MIVLRTRRGLPAAALTQIRLAALRFPGRERLQLVVGRRWLTLGCGYDASPACLAALAEFGEVHTFTDPGWHSQPAHNHTGGA